MSVIKTETDKSVLTDIVIAALDAMPKPYASNLLYELYATRVYEGDVYTVTREGGVKPFYFAGTNDVHNFFKNINAKYSKDNLFRVRNMEGRTLYGYTVSYTSKGKETIN